MHKLRTIVFGIAVTLLVLVAPSARANDPVSGADGVLRFPWYVGAAVVVIGAQAAGIAFLVLQRRRRRPAEAALRDRLDFETFVGRLSVAFVEGHRADVDGALRRALQHVGERLGLDRAIIMEVVADGEVMRAAHAWNVARTSAPTAPLGMRRFPWLVQRLRRGSLRLSSLDDLPADAVVDRDSLAALGVGPALVIPVIDETGLLGALVFGFAPETAARTPELLERLERVGEIFRGVLIRRRTELELQKLRGDVTHVGRVSTMGELAVSLAHELTQPLTAILTNAQVAERMLDSGRAHPVALREIVAEIADDDRRAGEVIRRLRDFVKKNPPRRIPLDLNAVVQDTVSLVHSDVIIRNVGLTLDLAAGLPPVRADRVELQQVLLNLVMNGLDAMRDLEPQQLRVATRLDDAGQLEISISDRGTGIPEDRLPRIFDAFYTTKHHGLGMGLSIARSLVEAHGGRLWARNNAEGGATFTLTLPPATGGR
jgi:signal transduction histidine kinase